MGRRKAISREIVNQKRNGVTNGRIYHLFDGSMRTVQNIWRRYRESHATNKRSRPGRQRATTVRGSVRFAVKS